ncbi:MAG: hypothetical protein JO215_04665 [Ktedonobacteraceae bacterium]|nr:hypothetical protein [Ktedonobacteraceae bacterium]
MQPMEHPFSTRFNGTEIADTTAPFTVPYCLLFDKYGLLKAIWVGALPGIRSWVRAA